MRFDFEEQIERASTLPAVYYTDPQILDSEKRHIFYPTWQLAGRLDQLPEPGTFFTTEITDEPILIARGQDGKIRGFHNVCRHRAGPVATGAGCRSAFQCGYHGWTYSLDGRLLTTPEFEGVACFNRDEMSLAPIRLETWNQFIFARISHAPPEPDLTAFLEDIPELCSNFDIPSMRLVQRRDYIVNCNWKVYVDNYLEGYHLPIVHPSLFKEIDYQAYTTTLRTYYSLQHAPIRPSVTGSTAGRRYTSADEQTEALYIWLFPNLMLNIYPDNLSTNLIVPLGPEKTLTIFEWFFQYPESERVREKIKQTIDFSDEIQQEDLRICEAVQRGLKSSSYDRGRYSAKRETGVHHFHSLWSRFMSRGA